MFERFTERARQVVVLAQNEALELGHDWIGTEHLLLGLLRVEDGSAALALGALDVDVDRTRGEVERIQGRGAATSTGQIPFTPRAKKVLELSLREALALGHNHIGPGHILLGLVREGGGVGARVLRDRGVDGAALREAVTAAMSDIRSAGPAPLPPRRVRRRTAPERTFGRQRRPVSWEHTLARVDRATDVTEDVLDALGADGWELAGTVQDAEGVLLIFKRPC